MQEANPVLESPNLSNCSGYPVLTRTQRHIVLGMLIGLQLFAAAICPVVLGSDWIQWGFVWMGCWLVTLFLAAAWGALGKRPIAKRLPESFGLAAFVGLAVVWSMSRSSPPTSSPMLGVLLMTLLPALVIMLPMTLFRKFRGWRICLNEEQPAAEPRFQFSLLQMLAWTTFMAIIFGLARSIAPEQMQNGESFESQDLLIYGVLLLVLLLLFVPIFISFAGAVLAQNGRRRFVISSIILTPLSAVLLCATFFLIEYVQMQPTVNMDIREMVIEYAIISGTLNLAFVVATFGTLIVLRFCGYRLVRVKPEITPVLSAQPSSATMDVRRSPFPYLVAAIALLGLFLCWPAYIIELANHQVGIDRAVEKEWIDLGANYARIRHEEVSIPQLTFSQTISQAALEKLQRTGNEMNLWILTIHAASFTDAQLKYLSNLRTVKDLDLTGSGISDGGLIILGDLPQLNNLNLNSTNVTDAGLEYLLGFRQLKSLNLAGTGVTKEGVEKLKKALPNCVISWNVSRSPKQTQAVQRPENSNQSP